MESILKLQADICKIFANDKRLEIINLLKDKANSTNASIFVPKLLDSI